MAGTAKADVEERQVNQPSYVPAPTPEANRELRELAMACRILAAEGHNDIVYGHMSARTSSPERFWLKGAGLGLEGIGPDELGQLDLDGTVLAGTRARHLEYPIHSEIYRRRADVAAVVHTHPVYGAVFGAICADLRPLTHEGTLIYKLTIYSSLRTRRGGRPPRVPVSSI
jgi:ribulose-5-phosphate 4-epimerase/fuculose-1-phosphate aldolase